MLTENRMALPIKIITQLIKETDIFKGRMNKQQFQFCVIVTTSISSKYKTKISYRLWWHWIQKKAIQQRIIRTIIRIRIWILLAINSTRKEMDLTGRIHSEEILTRITIAIQKGRIRLALRTYILMILCNSGSMITTRSYQTSTQDFYFDFSW